MSRLPSPASGTSPLGIRQIAEEYQQRYASRVRRARISGVVLLLGIATQLLLTAALVTRVVDLKSYLGATACVLPTTCFLLGIYVHSRAGAREAREQLVELFQHTTEIPLRPVSLTTPTESEEVRRDR
jgi:hypothetical protein